MNDPFSASRDLFIQGMSRISQFWGFPRAMGAIYGAIYLSPDPVSLDELVLAAAVSKGAVSTHVRHLERLGMVHKHLVVGQRKDFYTAETDFWRIIKNILLEREKSEFNQALNSVTESLAALPEASEEAGYKEGMAFYQQRLDAMLTFFRSLDQLVALALALDNFRIGAIQRLIKNAAREED